MAVESPFSLQVRADSASVVVEVCGQLDLMTAPETSHLPRSGDRRDRGDFVVDCGGVDFIDSSGLKCSSWLTACFAMTVVASTLTALDLR